MEFEKEEWFCEDCDNNEYHLCTCGNKICTSCGSVHKGPYPCSNIIAPLEL